jgi:hypothetical protein
VDDLQRIKRLAGMLTEAAKDTTVVVQSGVTQSGGEEDNRPIPYTPTTPVPANTKTVIQSGSGSAPKKTLPPLPTVKKEPPDPPDHGMMPLFNYPEGSPEAKAMRDLSPLDPRFPRATHFIHPDDSTGETMVPYDKFAKERGWNEPEPLPYTPPADDDFNPYDALSGTTAYSDEEDVVKPNPNAEWLSKQSPEWRRDAESGKLDATGNAAWTNNDPVHGDPIPQPSSIAKYGPNPRMPDHEGPVTIAPYTFDQYRAEYPGKPVPPGVVVPLSLTPGEPWTKPIVPESQEESVFQRHLTWLQAVAQIKTK